MNKSNQPNKPKLSKRRMARIRAMQALYQWQHTGQNGTDLILQFLTEQKMDQVEVNYFQELVAGVVEHVLAIDEVMRGQLDRSLNSLNPVELAVLRISIYELMHRLDIPYRVVINEALEITKRYGSVDGFKYVNGVLDSLVPKLRALEFQQNQSGEKRRDKKH